MTIRVRIAELLRRLADFVENRKVFNRIAELIDSRSPLAVEALSALEKTYGAYHPDVIYYRNICLRIWPEPENKDDDQ